MAAGNFASIDKYKAWVQQHVANGQTVDSCLKHAQDMGWTIKGEPITQDLITKYEQEAEEQDQAIKDQEAAEQAMAPTTDLSEKTVNLFNEWNELKKNFTQYSNDEALEKMLDLYKRTYRAKNDYIREHKSGNGLSGENKEKFNGVLADYNKLLRDMEEGDALQVLSKNIAENGTSTALKKLKSRFSSDDEWLQDMITGRGSRSGGYVDNPNYDTLGSRLAGYNDAIMNSDFMKSFMNVFNKRGDTRTIEELASMNDNTNKMLGIGPYKKVEEEEDYREREDEQPF